MSTTTAPDPRTGGMVSIMVMYRPPGAPPPTGGQPGKTSADQPPTYDSIFLGEQVPAPSALLKEENSSAFPLQEQPPGYNMVRVDVGSMEQGQEAEGAQARSVMAFCINISSSSIISRPLVAETSEGGELLRPQDQVEVVEEVDRVEAATPLVSSPRGEAGHQKTCGMV